MIYIPIPLYLHPFVEQLRIFITILLDGTLCVFYGKNLQEVYDSEDFCPENAFVQYAYALIFSKLYILGR